jgi:hypothetical protein
MAAMRRSVGWVAAAAVLAMGCSSPLTPLRPVGGIDAAIDRASRPVGATAVDAARDGRAPVSVGDAAFDILVLNIPDARPSTWGCQPGNCVTGFCANGVCCNTACSGPCVSCALPGRLGTCTPLAAGTVAASGGCPTSDVATCGMTGLCDGVGGCALYPIGTVCATGSCVDGTTARAASACDGLGSCSEGPQVACAPYTCQDGLCAPDDCQRNPADCSPPGRLDASSD